MCSPGWCRRHRDSGPPEQGGAFKYPAHNETVTVVDPVRGLFDLQSLFLYAVVAAALAGLGYAVYTNFIAKVGRRTGPRRRARAPRCLF